MAEPFLGMISAIRLDPSAATIDSDVFILDVDDVLWVPEILATSSS